MVLRRTVDASAGTPKEPDVTERVVTAAFELFAADGYEATTIEAITQRAGVARRTFFRYFRSKDDVIFPDHEELLGRAVGRLAELGDRTPVAAVCAATTLVFEHYVGTPERSLERYRLTRAVPALRAREIASVHGYHRAFTRYLSERFSAGAADPAEAALHAEVAAGAVIAAHNQVLREWLRHGGDERGRDALEAAFGYVCRTFEKPTRKGAGRGKDAEAVVVVVRTDDSAAAVATRIRRLLDPATGAERASRN